MFAKMKQKAPYLMLLLTLVSCVQMPGKLVLEPNTPIEGRSYTVAPPHTFEIPSYEFKKDGIVFKPKWNFEAYRTEVDSMIKHHWETSYPYAKYGGNGQIPWDSCLNWEELEGFPIIEQKNSYGIPTGDTIWLPMPRINSSCPNLETELLIVPAYHSIYVNLYRFKDTTIAYPGILAGNGIWDVKSKRWIQVSGAIMGYEGALIPRTEESTISPHDTTDTPQSFYSQFYAIGLRDIPISAERKIEEKRFTDSISNRFNSGIEISVAGGLASTKLNDHQGLGLEENRKFSSFNLQYQLRWIQNRWGIEASFNQEYIGYGESDQEEDNSDPSVNGSWAISLNEYRLGANYYPFANSVGSLYVGSGLKYGQVQSWKQESEILHIDSLTWSDPNHSFGMYAKAGLGFHGKYFLANFEFPFEYSLQSGGGILKYGFQFVLGFRICRYC